MRIGCQVEEWKQTTNSKAHQPLNLDQVQDKKNNQQKHSSTITHQERKAEFIWIISSWLTLLGLIAPFLKATSPTWIHFFVQGNKGWNDKGEESQQKKKKREEGKLNPFF